MPQCRVATWRSSVVLDNAGGDHTGAHVKACAFKSLVWCFLAVFTAVGQSSLLINSALPESAGSWASLLLSSEERVGKYNRGRWVSEPLLIVNLSLRPRRNLGCATECVVATKDRASQKSPEASLASHHPQQEGNPKSVARERFGES